MSLIRAKELREKRFKLYSDARALIDKDSPTDEDTARFDVLMGECEALVPQIKRAEQIENLEEESRQSAGGALERDKPNQDANPASPEEIEKRKNRDFYNWIFNGEPGSERASQRTFMRRLPKREDEKGTAREHRAQSTSTTAGGYTIAQGFSNELERALLAFGGNR